MRTSTRSKVDPFIVMDVMEAARRAEEAGRHIIHMEVGQPGTGAPKVATDALARAMEAGAAWVYCGAWSASFACADRAALW